MVLNTPPLRVACCDDVSQIETQKIQQQGTNQALLRVKQPPLAVILPLLPQYSWIFGV